MTLAAAFEILGVAGDATPDQVKLAFRDLAQVWHPDRFANSERLRSRAEAKMREINCAYDYLKQHFASTHSGSRTESSNATSSRHDQTQTNESSQGANGGKCARAETVGDGSDKARSAKPSPQPTKRSPKRKSGQQGWWRDPVLRWAWIVPTIIMIPFVSYLAWQWYVAHYRQTILRLEIEARELVASEVNRAAYGRYQELKEYVGNSDPGTDETRRAVESAKTESERLYPLVRGELATEEANARLKSDRDMQALYWVIGVIILCAVVIAAAATTVVIQDKSNQKEAEKRAIANRCPACLKLSAMEFVGETVLSQTPRIKTVTQRSATFNMFGQPIYTHAQNAQVIVFDIIGRTCYRCKYCNHEELSEPYDREFIP
jgi:hypothetical protein